MVKKFRGIQRHHLLGIGLIGGAIGVFQFASRNGYLARLPGIGSTELVEKDGPSTKASNPITPATSSVPQGQTASASNSNSYYGTQPNGVPVAYNGSPYNEYSAGNSSVQQVVPYGPTVLYNPSNPTTHDNMSQQPQVQSYASQGDIQVYFSPKGGCTDAIVRELNRAQQQILIQAYSFTSEPIAAAAVNAHQRGVAVFAVLDKSQQSEQYTAADLLANSGIPTVIDSVHAIAHNKVILIDGQTLITGSFNFTSNAEQSNAENLLIIRNHPSLYSAYEENLRHHYEHSKPYAGRGAVNETTQTGTHHPRNR